MQRDRGIRRCSPTTRGRDDSAMTDESALDDAIHVATERTTDAQAEVDRRIDDPQELPKRAEVVVNRAEDLHVLTEEAAGDPDASH
jgi:hypothetical protein